MFDLGESFSAFVIYTVLWIAGYFVWAFRSEKGNGREES
jgi:hypothetical protein